MRAVRTVYNGASYPSKKEARYAEQLDVKLAAGQIAHWTRGKTIFLKGADDSWLLMPSGRRAYYRPDFEVLHLDGSLRLVEVKGRRDTKDPAYRLWCLKRAILRSMQIEVQEV
jgi:hypothetical protein